MSTAVRPATWTLAACLAVAALAACTLSPSGGTVRVTALWVQGQDSGAAAVEVEHSDSATNTDGDGDFVVDLDPLRAVGGGPTWQASAWTAATVAMLRSGEDPRGQQLSLRTTAGVGDASASAVLAAGALAALTSQDPVDSVSLVGTIMPTGSIAAVPGVAERMRAAADAGLATVLIPDGVSREPRDRREEPVQLQQLGESLGLRVRPVATVDDAVAFMTESPPPPPPQSVDVDQALTQVLDRETRRSLVRLRGLARDVADRQFNTPAGRRALAEARATARSVPRLLVRGESFVAFAQATLAEGELLQYSAEQRTLASVRSRGVRRTRVALQRQVAVERRLTSTVIRRAARRDLQYLEQYPALADALTWGTGNLAILAAAGDRLDGRGAGRAVLVAASGEIERALYRLDTYLPIQLAAVDRIGRVAVTDTVDSLSLLDSYAELLGQGADAVMSYYQSLPARNRPLQRLIDRLAAQQRLWRDAAPAADPQQPVVLERLAWALSYYVASSYLFTLGPLLAKAGAGQPAVLLDPGYFSDQVNIATGQNLRAAARVKRSGLDPSYVEWGNEWGLALADQGAGVSVPDEIRARGLSYQWYAAVQASMLSALSGGMAVSDDG